MTFTVFDLKRFLKQRGLKVSGKKVNLVARLEEYDAKQYASAFQVQPETANTEITVHFHF